MPSRSAQSFKAESATAGTRLDSWKEIAAYLRRGERTVKRWEADRGLPIHRVPGSGRASVYAYTAELDQWLNLRPPSDLDDPDAGETADTEPDDSAYAGEPKPSVSAIAQPPKLHLSWVSRLKFLTVAGMLAMGLTILGFSTRGSAVHLSAALPAMFARSPAKAPKPLAPDSETRVAHDFYLKGRYEWSQRTPESLNRALDDFTQAVVHNPNDAKSYVGLADTYNLLHIYSTLPLTDSYPRAIAAARRAVQLDDNLAEAHRALAFAEFYGAGDYRESEKEFLRAIQIDPNDPVTRRWYGNAFAMPGRYEQSMEQFDKAQELDPASHSTLSDKGIVLFNYGRRAEGISLLKQVESTDPDFFSSHIHLMQIAFELHDYPSFFDEGEKAAKIRNDSVLKDILDFARQGYERSGERGLLKNLYTKQKQYFEMGKLPGGSLAITCVAMGKRQEAIELLEIEYDRHEADALWGLSDPQFRALKDEPGYKALIKKINFPEPPAALSPDQSRAGDDTRLAPH